METFIELLKNFFTHKDFLPPPEEWYGTLFSPLQILFCTVIAAFIAFACFRCAKKSERFQKTVFFCLWLIMLITEPIIVLYDAFAGERFFIDWTSTLPFWPCSIFLFTAPFAIFGKGKVRYAACGYICTLGLLGGFVNFVYPASYLFRYSCISFAGFRTVFYHGSMVFTAVTMLLSDYHGYRDVKSWKQVLLPSVPALMISIPANILNFTISGADYMFFKAESFFFAPIGKATPDWVSVIFIYLIYLIIHCTPYLPSYFANQKENDR